MKAEISDDRLYLVCHNCRCAAEKWREKYSPEHDYSQQIQQNRGKK